MSSYKLSLNSVRSINRTIVAVNQMRKTGVVGDLPFRQNQKRQQAACATLQIGKTTADWIKGATQDITPTDTDGNAKGDSVTVLNLFADVEGAGKWCAFMKSGGTFILIAAECE